MKEAGGQGAALDATVKTESWYPTEPAVSVLAREEWSRRSGWPEVVMEKWERNDAGERRIVARCRYTPGEEL